MRSILRWMLLATMVLAGAPAMAVDAPTGPVLLTLSGNLANSNQAGKLALDQALLDSLPVTSVETETPWTEGKVKFDGVSLAALLDFAGAKGANIHAIALNDYAVDIPAADAADPNVIVAYRMNGERMRVRDKGPFWLIYPLSSEPALNTEATHSKMIWQIKELVIQ